MALLEHIKTCCAHHVLLVSFAKILDSLPSPALSTSTSSPTESINAPSTLVSIVQSSLSFLATVQPVVDKVGQCTLQPLKWTLGQEPLHNAQIEHH